LAEKQDNEKNQIYFGEGLGGVSSLFPSVKNLRSPSESFRKRKSQVGIHKIEAQLDFEWFESDGTSHPAPNTKIIDYFQYPEVRLSGFLSGCTSPPDALRRKNQEKYGKRVLVLGTDRVSKTYGLIITEKDDPIVSRFPVLADSETVSVFQTHIIGTAAGDSPKVLLRDELLNLSGVWHPSTILKASGRSAFKGNQGAGYTLEALLDIAANASKEPDKYGFEIKSFKKSGKVSLMTLTADRGEEGRLSFVEFINEYGWLGMRGDGRQVFNGTFRYGKPNARTGLILGIDGYDEVSDLFSVSPLVSIRNLAAGILVSGWSFDKLMNSWSKKHVSACYVEYTKRPYNTGGHDAEYMYTGRVIFCEGTTIFHYLQGIVQQIVYYDPAHEVSADGTSHVRPQWRMSVNKHFSNSLSPLYNSVIEENLI